MCIASSTPIVILNLKNLNAKPKYSHKTLLSTNQVKIEKSNTKRNMDSQWKGQVMKQQMNGNGISCYKKRFVLVTSDC